MATTINSANPSPVNHDKISSSHKVAKNSHPKPSALKKPAQHEAIKASLPSHSLELLQVIKSVDKVNPEESGKPPISHKIAAHFLSGPFIKDLSVDSEALEGSPWSKTTAYFLHTLKEVESSEKLTDDKDVVFLRKSLSQMLCVEAAVQKIRSIYPQPEQWENRAKLFAEWMSYMLTKMKAGEQWMIPGGWSGKRSPGHAEIYHFIKQENGCYTMRIYNAGAGIEHHIVQGSKVLPLSKEDLSLNSLQRKEVWQTYYEMLHEHVPDPTNPSHPKYHAEPTEVNCYQWLESIQPHFIQDGAKEVLATKLKPTDFHSQQKYNTCTFECIWMLAKQTPSFLHIKDKIREKAFLDYEAYLVRQGYLPAHASARSIHSVTKVPHTYEEVIKNQGILDFFHEYLKRFAKETLKEIRKRPDDLSFERRKERSALLKDLEMRIELQRTACHAKLKELMVFKPSQTDSSNISIERPKKLAAAPGTHSTDLVLPPGCPSVQWPAKENLEKRLAEWNDFCSKSGSEEVNFRYLAIIISQIPSVDDPYWNDLGNSSAACMKALSSLVGTLRGISPSEHPFEADLHYFHMEKILAILLKLSQADPILSKVIVDLHWLPGSGKSDTESYRTLFSFDPQTDRQIVATRDFLKNYTQQKGKAAIFSEMRPTAGDKGQFLVAEQMNNGNTFSSSKEAATVWEYLQADGGLKKKEIEKTIKEAYPELGDKLLPNSLILAYAMLYRDSQSSPEGIPTASFRIVKEHLFYMFSRLYLQPGTFLASTLSPSLDEYAKDPKIDSFTLSVKGRKGDSWSEQWAKTSGVKEPLFSKKEKETLEFQDEELRGLHSLCSEGIHGKKEGFFEQDPMDRPVRALEFFTKYSHLLDQTQNQAVLYSCLFHPGLLRAQLKSNPEFAIKLVQFIRVNYASASKRSIETALFLLRLSSQLEPYCRDALGENHPILKESSFPFLLQELPKLQTLIKENEELSSKGRTTLQSLIAREALAFLGRGDGSIHHLAAKPELLQELFQYEVFLAENAVPKQHKDSLLEGQIKRGRFALVRLFQKLGTDPVFARAACEALTNAFGLKLSAKEKITWDFNSLPIIKGSMTTQGKKDGKKDYAFYLHTGELFIDGKRSSSQCPDWTPIDICMRFTEDTSCSQFREEAGPPRLCYFMANGKEFCFMEGVAANKCSVFIKHKDSWCEYYFPLALSDRLPSIHKYAHPFLDGDKIRFFSKTTGQLSYLYDFRKQRLMRLKDRFVAADMDQIQYRPLKNFDSAAQVWKTAEGTIKQIEFPNYGIVFNADKTGQLLGTGDFAGMRIAEQQAVQSLTGVPGYLVVEHVVTKERRVLLPIRSLSLKKEYTKPNDDLVNEALYTSSYKKDYAVLNIIGKKELLEPSRQEKRVQESLYLVRLYMAQHKYAQAYRILEEEAISPQPYTADEWGILLQILQDKSSQAKESPEAVAIRLKTAALITMNKQRGTIEFSKEESNILSDWTSYLDSRVEFSWTKTLQGEWGRYCQYKSQIPEFMRLTSEEESLLRESIFDPDDSPAPQFPKEYSIATEGPHAQRELDRHDNVWEYIAQANPVPSLKILDERVFSFHLTMEEMGEAFWGFYAICCDSSIDPASLERKARLNTLLENVFANTNNSRDGSVGQISKLLQMILQGKVAKEKIPALKELQTLISDKNRSLDQYKQFDDFCKIASLHQPREGFNYQLPFQPISKPQIPATPPTGYQPLPHQAIATALPILDDLSRASLFTQTPKNPLIPREFINKEFAKEKAEKNALTALQESAQGYVTELETSGNWAIEDFRLGALEKILTSRIERDRSLLRKRKQALRHLANAYPILSSSSIEDVLKHMSGLKEKIDWHHLQLLYVQGNALAYKELNPLLDNDMVEEIYHRTEQLLLDSTQQKQRIRALDLIQAIKKAKSAHERAELTQKLYQELSSKRAYSPAKHPEILVYEYRRNLRLRESQVRQIETLMDQNQDRVLEIIMGSGKSDILLPLLALKLADGKKLSMLILPEELIGSVAPQMHIRARGIFRQTANRLDWNQYPEDLYKNLKKIIDGREFLLVTSNELHQFALAARKAREDYLKLENATKFQTTKLRNTLKAYRQVLQLLKTQGHAIIDEVDSQLRTDLQVLRALGIPTRIPKEYCDATAILFDVLKSDKKIKSRVYFDFSETHEKNAKPYVEKEHKAFLIERLAKGFLASPKMKQLRLSYQKKRDYKAVLAYLTEAPEKGILLPEYFDQRTKDTLAIVRNQLHVIFPITLGKLYGENYGLAPEKTKKKEKEKETLTAIPYGGALKPRPESEFASYQEQISYTFQSYLKEGVPGKLVKFHIEKIRSEMLTEIKRTSLAPEMTDAYGRYVSLLGKTLATKYPLETITTKQCEEIAKAISEKPRLLLRFINRCVLPLIKQHPGYISSNGKTLADMLHRVHGVSGTVERDKDSLSSRFEVTTDETIRGKTLVCSEKIEKPLILKNSLKPLELLKETLEKAAAHKEIQDHNLRALIDRGALFKDLPPIEVAKAILEWGKTQKMPIESVVYYDKNKKLVLEQGKTEPQFYNADLDKDPAKRFTFYPQPQTVGADIPQAFNAAAIITINKNTDYQQVEQAGWRMRGLDKGQCLLFVALEDAASLIAEKAEKPLEDLTSSDLLTYTVQREVRTQMINNPKAIYQMLDSALLNQCEAIFDAVEVEKWQNTAYKELHSFTTTTVKDEPYKQFGQNEVLEEAEQVLHRHRTSLIEKLGAWFKKHEDTLKGDLGGQLAKILDIDGLDHQMRKIIGKAVDPKRPLVPETLPTKQNAAQETEVELEQETEKETEQENEQENQREVNLTLRKMEDWCEPLSWIDPKKMFEEEFFTPYTLSETVSLSDFLKDKGNRPLLTVGDALLMDQEGISPSQKKISTFFDPKLMTSFNAASASGAGHLFRGNQRPLGSTLLIQDRENPQNVRLVLLSFDEEKELLKYLRQDQQKGGDVDSRRYSLALFSPTMHSAYGDGIYAQGATPIDREGLYAKGSKGAPLTAFERLIVQSKVAMGETRAYSPREQEFIYEWLKSQELVPEEFRKVFERIFLPGMVQTFANSTFETLLKTQLAPSQKQSVPSQIQEDVIKPLDIPGKKISADSEDVRVATYFNGIDLDDI